VGRGRGRGRGIVLTNHHSTAICQGLLRLFYYSWHLRPKLTLHVNFGLTGIYEKVTIYWYPRKVTAVSIQIMEQI
jgi:hypothetical protein